ncbi:carboxymuconolactone decarboxylase family protein [Rhodoferax lacus]|uniref:Carboxymuconolactone decarboxylase family protein n=1 Tax=Rhodoferax lacus TaxID=2184758 RepID=A0A3E1R8X9_9BURK|nr:carboxymuconolactone decarboxylase family protein [Rhodoferax lacus]RFO95681.1 carboxymuconolactone decarboxylase family protein [Rhodoferax lacus]
MAEHNDKHQNATAAPRIATVPDSALQPAEVVEAIRKRRGGTLLNLDRMLLNSPAYAVGWNTFLGAVRNGLSLDPKLRELAICYVAVLNRADYELLQHAPEFLAAGGTQAQLDALRDMDAALADAALKDVASRGPTVFDATERAVLQLTLEMTRQVQVSEACFARVQQALGSAQQQVELVGVIAAYNMVSRFLEALRVAPEAG